MNDKRKIILFKNYFADFFKRLSNQEKNKVYYEFDMLKTREVIAKKFVKLVEDGIYELRIELSSNIYRVFFIFDGNNIVVLFNGFQKKTQKTPRKEIEKAKQIRKEYYDEKRRMASVSE